MPGLGEPGQSFLMGAVGILTSWGGPRPSEFHSSPSASMSAQSPRRCDHPVGAARRVTATGTAGNARRPPLHVSRASFVLLMMHLALFCCLLCCSLLKRTILGEKPDTRPSRMATGAARATSPHVSRSVSGRASRLRWVLASPSLVAPRSSRARSRSHVAPTPRHSRSGRGKWSEHRERRPVDLELDERDHDRPELQRGPVGADSRSRGRRNVRARRFGRGALADPGPGKRRHEHPGKSQCGYHRPPGPSDVS